MKFLTTPICALVLSIAAATAAPLLSSNNTPELKLLESGGLIVEETKPSDGNIAMLIIPGGGYQGVAKDSRDMFAIDWLKTNGIRCFYLRYMLPFTNAIVDTAAAWDYINTNALALNLDPTRIGIYGASCGAHLASLVIGRTKFKPAFAVMACPLITMSQGPINKAIAVSMAGGGQLTEEFLKVASAERYLNGTNLPPVFIVQNANDGVLSAMNSMILANLAEANQVPYELHLFRSTSGEHGFDAPWQWLPDCLRFMKQRGFITTK